MGGSFMGMLNCLTQPTCSGKQKKKASRSRVKKKNTYDAERLMKEAIRREKKEEPQAQKSASVINNTRYYFT